jgi:tRNA threonylcarbamoyladenosine biosynthesis protein TsaE
VSQPGLVLKSSSSESTREIGSIIASVCHPGDVIALSGDLGAGKTTLTQGIAKGLGIDESVTSPTFVLIKHYSGDRVGLTHIDLYRLESEEEALALDLDELFYGDSVVVVEWPDRFMSVFPDQYLLLTISYSGLDERVVEVTGVGQRGDELVEKLRELFSGSQYL